MASRPDVVVLVHGIRTRAPWYVSVRDELARAGFRVELSNYGRFGIVRFILPVPFFKTWAAADVERDIRDAMLKHSADTVSVIAHSFGTFVIASILRKKFDIAFKRIIFCGSVVKFRFPFEQCSGRFDGDVVNEVGTRDIWPILAQSVTWGYGPTGAFGFSRPRVFDRYHRGVSHSAFLNAEFCKKWWIPILLGGEPVSSDEPEPPPWWLRLLSVFRLKNLAVIFLTVWSAFHLCRAPREEVRIPDDIYNAGELIGRLVSEAAQRPSSWCPELLRGRRNMTTTGVEGATETLWLCRTPVSFSYIDPTDALQILSRRIPCLETKGIADRELEVRVNRTFAKEVKAKNGKSLWLCGCDESEVDRVLKIVN